MKITSLKEFNAVDWSKKIEGDVEISANLGILRPERVWCAGSLRVEAGTSIKAGGSIKAGTYIKAESRGILAGLSISCKLILSAKMRIIAGITPWEDGSNPEMSIVTCGKLESGTVVGTLVETGLPDEPSSGCQHRQTGKFCSECGASLITPEGETE